jgi:hypothetical protein
VRKDADGESNGLGTCRRHRVFRILVARPAGRGLGSHSVGRYTHTWSSGGLVSLPRRRFDVLTRLRQPQSALVGLATTTLDAAAWRWDVARLCGAVMFRSAPPYLPGRTIGRPVRSVRTGARAAASEDQSSAVTGRARRLRARLADLDLPAVSSVSSARGPWSGTPVWSAAQSSSSRVRKAHPQATPRSSPSSLAPAIPPPGRRSDRPVLALSTDHLAQSLSPGEPAARSL